MVVRGRCATQHDYWVVIRGWLAYMTWALVVGIAILACGTDGKDLVTVKTYSFPIFDSYQSCFVQGKRTKSGFTCKRIEE